MNNNETLSDGHDATYIHNSLPPWENTLLTEFSTYLTDPVCVSSNISHPPSFFAHAPLRTLLTYSTPRSLHLGTADAIFSSLFASLESATSEILFVTCFWAPSPALTALAHALRRVSATVVARNHGDANARPIRVRIGLSRLPCLWQLAAHPATLRGLSWPPSTWAPELGLPAADELPGLQLSIRSVFVPPFGVAHPKFCVIDRRQAWVPSCNVSWETWFEGAVHLEGKATVDCLVQFWDEAWGNEPAETDAEDLMRRSLAWRLERMLRAMAAKLRLTSPSSWRSDQPANVTTDVIPLPNQLQLDVGTAIPTLLLPHPHHRDPWTLLRPFRQPEPPPTPLNVFLLNALDAATATIYLQTPNLTAAPVAAALLRALDRGVDVRVVTSRTLMRLEQLVLAGWTTASFVRRRLVAPYRRLAQQRRAAATADARRDAAVVVESGVAEDARLGRLEVAYFQSLPGETTAGGETLLEHSHLKLTIVDGRVTVLGSGNMDRPSWYVSQELGIAFLSMAMADVVTRFVGQWVEERTDVAFDSNKEHVA